MGHFSEANLSFAEEQPHFRHFPIPRRAEAFQYWHLSQIAWRFAKVVILCVYPVVDMSVFLQDYESKIKRTFRLKEEAI